METLTTTTLAGHVLAGCILNPCSPGVQINPPPITSSSGMVLGALVFAVMFWIGASIGGSGKGKGGKK